MSFGQAISTCMRKYTTFSGRAKRSEFWQFVLFVILLHAALWIVSLAVFRLDGPNFPLLNCLIHLVFIIPWFAAASRRLHDIGKSGWWQLIGFIPLIGPILLIVWLATNTKASGDKYNQTEVS